MAAFGLVLYEFIGLGHEFWRHPGPRFAKPGLGCETPFHGRVGARVAVLRQSRGVNA